MFIPQQIFGILGNPLGHSLSPVLHNWGFQEQNYPAAYFRFEKTNAELADFMQSLRSLPLSGLSVTIPHKSAVMPFLDEISQDAQQAGAVNTIYWQDSKLCGHNTDIGGFCAPLERLFAPTKASKDALGILSQKKALILGAGGAARAAIIGLKKLACAQIYISTRRLEQAELLAQEFDLQTVEWENRHNLLVDLVVNSTPLGMQGKNESLSPYSANEFMQIHGSSLDPANLPLAYDLIYTPAKTLFLEQASLAKWQTLNGFDMFVAQGLAQFKIFTGVDLNYQAAAKLLSEHLAQR